MSDKDGAVSEQKAIVEEAQLKTHGRKEQREALEDYEQAAGIKQDSMRVKVYSPYRDYYDGLALSVSAANATGEFDILPKHHNFISLLSPCDLIVRTVKANDDRTIRISGGIMHVKADKIIVFLDV